MSLPSAYLTSTKNLSAILGAIKTAQAPPRFTIKFLEGLGFPSSADRLIINVLKSLGFLNDTGQPTERYHQYLDKSQSKTVLAAGVREAYADLFQINRNAQTMTRADVQNKMKTLSQGAFSDSVLAKMATTFTQLSSLASFDGAVQQTPLPVQEDGVSEEHNEQREGNRRNEHGNSGEGPRDRLIDGLVYNINIHLPESRDTAVYDALFRSLREHLL